MAKHGLLMGMLWFATLACGRDYVREEPRATAAGPSEAEELDKIEARYLGQLENIEKQLQALEVAASIEGDDKRGDIIDQTKSIRERLGDTHDRVQALEERGQNRSELWGDIDHQLGRMTADVDRVVDDLTPAGLRRYNRALQQGIGAVGGTPLTHHLERLNVLRARVLALEEAAERAPDDVREFVAETTKNVRDKHEDAYNRVLALERAGSASFEEMSGDIENAIDDMEDDMRVAANRLSPDDRANMQRIERKLLKGR